MDLDGSDAIGDFLAGCAPDEYLYLPDLGWLSTKAYQPYLGPGVTAPVKPPPKVLPFLRPDPDLLRAVNGLPPAGRRFRSERARYFDMLHPGAKDRGEERFTVQRPPWTDALAATLRRHLVAEGRVEVDRLGIFEVVEKPGRPGMNPDTGERIQIPARKIVRYSAAPELKLRLAGRAEIPGTPS